MHPSDDSDARRQKGLSLKNQGDELTRLGGAENLAKAVQLCDEAIVLLGDQPVAADGSDRDELASAWMKRGIALLNMGAPEALAEAIRCFDQAIELRKKLPLAENAAFRYGLAACWLNRGDALARIGGEENLDPALASHAEAIALLETLPLETDPLYVKRLAIAWLNRGIALEFKKTAPALAEAIQSYHKTIALLENPKYAGDGSLDFILAGAWLNAGNATLQASGETAAPETCAAAEKALSLVAKTESREPESAEIGFKARNVLCRATIALLMATENADARMDLIGKITDTVEDGLRLAQQWEKGRVAHFRPIATQLFHVGALVYEKEQPQFLSEFLIDHLDPDRATCVMPLVVHLDNDWYTIATQALARVRQRVHSLDFALLATPQGQHWIDIMNGVTEAESRLQELREGVVSV